VNRRFPMILFIAGLCAYLTLLVPFSTYMRNKPIEEKLGYVPSIKLLKPLSADQRELAGAWLVFKVTMYFGGLLAKAQEGVLNLPRADLPGMSRLLHGAVQLDPYNMDAYYFAQSFLTWDAGQFKVANDLLDYGMRYRSWDWYLPFFAGFNHAFFLKDYGKAAEYYRKAAELSGSELYASLSGRYLHESGQTELAIGYLAGMAKAAKNQSVKLTYEIRLKAFVEVRRIEEARDRFVMQRGVLPDSVDQLVQSGFLNPVPVDPYGGKFYIGPEGKVSTTSRFAFSVKHK